MLTIRRLYLYLVAAASLEVVLWGVIGLLRSIFAGAEVGGSVTRLAGALSLILVGSPVFLLHWWLAQRSALRDIEEFSARTRAVFQYGILLATLLPILQNLLAMLNRLFQQMFGLDPTQSMFGRYQSLSDNLIAISANAMIAAYFFIILKNDWQKVRKGEAFTEIRRLFRYFWWYYSLVLSIMGVNRIIHFILSQPGAVGQIPVALPGSLALLLLGIPLFAYTWIIINRSLVQLEESQSLIRLVVLYSLVFIGAATVLTSAGFLLDVILKFALGEKLTVVSFLAQLNNSLPLGLPLAGVWLYFGRLLNNELSILPDTPRRSGLRRLYHYVLSLLGLGAGFVGLQLLFSSILDLWLGENIVWEGPNRNLLAHSLSALLVGVPVWYLSWRLMQSESAELSEAGDHARRSVIRKIFLYFVMFVAVIGIMASAGVLLYQILQALLGQPPKDLLLNALQMIKTLVLFALLLAFHGQSLRSDSRLAERSLITRHANFPVLVVASELPEFTTSVVDALTRQVPGIPVNVHPSGQEAPGESLANTRAVILPGAVAANPGEPFRLWLEQFSGTRLVVPTPAKDWHWVFGSERPLASLARQTATIVRHLAEGEELRSGQETSPWMVVVYVVGGLILLPLIISIISSMIGLMID